MTDFLTRLAELASLFHLQELAKSLARALLVYSAFFIVVYALEVRAGADRARYRTRNFFNDIVYTLFYRGALYNVLILAAITNALEPRLGSLRLDLLGGAPWPVQLAIFWVGGDFVMYWWHRLQHSNRFLWALHSVHHSQEHMTLLTAARRHPLETLSLDVLIFFGIFHVLLGVPTRGWLPLAALITSILAIQHAQLDWRLGPLYRVLVSPRFHSFHHSTDPAHLNANYGFLFSTWDYLFGTAVPEQPRPARYGVDGLDMKETLTSQLVMPFRMMWRWRRRVEPRLEPPAPARISLPEKADPFRSVL